MDQTGFDKAGWSTKLESVKWGSLPNWVVDKIGLGEPLVDDFVLTNASRHVFFIYALQLSLSAASIDVNRIIQGGIAQSKVLQDVLQGIAFCNIDQEFNRDDNQLILPPGISKLFKISQLVIQYLLYSQKKLAEGITNVQENNDKLQNVSAKNVFSFGRFEKHVFTILHRIIVRSQKSCKHETRKLKVSDWNAKRDGK